MTKFNFNQQATEALEDLLDTNALEVRISLCNDITDKILSGLIMYAAFIRLEDN